MDERSSEESQLRLAPSRISQAFPGFRAKSATFVISALQVLYYTISVVLAGAFINPSNCSLYNLGAMVFSI